MKVLFVADVSIAEVIGGGERVLFEQAKEMSKRGHELHVLTRRLPEHKESFQIITRGIKEWRYEIDRNNNLSFFKTSRVNARILFETIEQDIHFNYIISHQPFSSLGVNQSPLSKNIKKFYICHSLSFEEYISRNPKPDDFVGRIFHFLNIFIRKRIEKKAIDSSDKIIVLSEFTKNKLIEIHKINTNKIELNPGGVDLDRFKPSIEKTSIREELDIPEEKIILLTVRNLVHRMGLENLIKALELVVKNTPDIFLVIGGDGPLKNKLITLTNRLGLGDYVRFSGFIPDDDLPDYYRMSDLFVLPTKELEGFGLVTLESMATGLPVVGTPVGGTKEILNKFDSAFLFKDTTPEAMAEIILKYHRIIKYSPQEWKETSVKCRKYVEDNYSWAKNVDELEKLLIE